MPLRALAGALLLLLPGCVAASAPAIINAVSNTAIAAAASGVSRATGDCFASCPDGTSCNRATGLCEALPCRGRCATNERCELNPVERCVPLSEVELKINRQPEEPERVTPQ